MTETLQVIEKQIEVCDGKFVEIHSSLERQESLLNKIYKVVCGNGVPGLDERTTFLEKVVFSWQEERRKRIAEQIKIRREIYKGVIVGLILLGANIIVAWMG